MATYNARNPPPQCKFDTMQALAGVGGGEPKPLLRFRPLQRRFAFASTIAVSATNYACMRTCY